jgi:hypothetical protein
VVARIGLQGLMSLPPETRAREGITMSDITTRAAQIAGEFPDSTEQLDVRVHDVFSLKATEVNNQGIEAQVAYLLENGEPESEIRDMLAEPF